MSNSRKSKLIKGRQESKPQSSEELLDAYILPPPPLPPVIVELNEFKRQLDKYRLIVKELSKNSHSLENDQIEMMIKHLHSLTKQAEALSPEKTEEYSELIKNISSISNSLSDSIKSPQTGTKISRDSQIAFADIMTHVSISQGYPNSRFVKELRKRTDINSVSTTELEKSLKLENAKYNYEEMKKLSADFSDLKASADKLRHTDNLTLYIQEEYIKIHSEDARAAFVNYLINIMKESEKLNDDSSFFSALQNAMINLNNNYHISDYIDDDEDEILRKDFEKYIPTHMLESQLKPEQPAQFAASEMKKPISVEVPTVQAERVTVEDEKMPVLVDLLSDLRDRHFDDFRGRLVAFGDYVSYLLKEKGIDAAGDDMLAVFEQLIPSSFKVEELVKIFKNIREISESMSDSLVGSCDNEYDYWLTSFSLAVFIKLKATSMNSDEQKNDKLKKDIELMEKSLEKQKISIKSLRKDYTSVEKERQNKRKEALKEFSNKGYHYLYFQTVAKPNQNKESNYNKELQEFFSKIGRYDSLIKEIKKNTSVITKEQREALIKHLEHLVNDGKPYVSTLQNKVLPHITGYLETLKRIPSKDSKRRQTLSVSAQVRYAVIMTGAERAKGVFTKKYIDGLDVLREKHSLPQVDEQYIAKMSARIDALSKQKEQMSMPWTPADEASLKEIGSKFTVLIKSNSIDDKGYLDACSTCMNELDRAKLVYYFSDDTTKFNNHIKAAEEALEVAENIAEQLRKTIKSESAAEAKDKSGVLPSPPIYSEEADDSEIPPPPPGADDEPPVPPPPPVDEKKSIEEQYRSLYEDLMSKLGKLSVNKEYDSTRKALLAEIKSVDRRLKDIEDEKNREANVLTIVNKLAESADPGDRRLAQFIAIGSKELTSGEIAKLVEYSKLSVTEEQDRQKIYDEFGGTEKLRQYTNRLALAQVIELVMLLKVSDGDVRKQVVAQLEIFKKMMPLFVTDRVTKEKIESKLAEAKTIQPDRPSLDINIASKLAQIEYRQAILERRKLDTTKIIGNPKVDKNLKSIYKLLQPTLTTKKIDETFIGDITSQLAFIKTIRKNYDEDPLFFATVKSKYKNELLFTKELISRCEAIKAEIARRLQLDPKSGNIGKIELELERVESVINSLKEPKKELKESAESKERNWLTERKAKHELEINLAMVELRQAMIEGRVAHNTAQIQEDYINGNKYLSEQTKEKYNVLYKEYRDRKIDNFDVQKFIGLIGNYEVKREYQERNEKGKVIVTRTEIESTEDSDKRVLAILGDEGYKALHAGFEQPESTSARELYMHALQRALDKHKQVGDRESPTTMKDLLGEEGVKLYKAAMAEEAATKAFRNAVFLRSVKSYYGPEWAKKLVLWIGGPSASGKTFATDGMIAKITRGLGLMPTVGTRDVDNYVVSIDGAIEREVSQIRQLTLQTALVVGNTGIEDLQDTKPKKAEKSKFHKIKDKFIHAGPKKPKVTKKLKDRILQAVQASDKNLSIAIPETFTKFTAKTDKRFSKEFSKFAKDSNNLHIYSSVVSSSDSDSRETFRLSVQRMGTSRAFLKNGKVYSGITINNLAIGCESKRYDPGLFSLFYQQGIDKSKEAARIYREVQGKYSATYDFRITNDLVYIIYDTENKEWRECNENDSGEVVMITARAFKAWKHECEKEKEEEKEEENRYEKIYEWLADESGGNKAELQDPLIKLFVDGDEVDLELERQLNDLNKLVKKAQHNLSLIKDEDQKTALGQKIKFVLDLVSNLESHRKDNTPWKPIISITQKQIDELSELSKKAEKYFEGIRSSVTPNISKQEIEVIYQKMIVQKALEAKDYRFDIQGHIITEVKLDVNELRKILIASGVNEDSVKDLTEFQAKEILQRIIGPITEKTYCTVDVIGHSGLGDEFKKWLLQRHEKLENLEAAVDALIKSDQRSTINALQKEMEMHMRLSSRVMEQKAKELKINISTEKWENVRTEASKNLNNLMREKFQEALAESYDTTTRKINISELNKILDTQRKELSKLAKEYLLTAMISAGVTSDNVDKILAKINKEDFEKVTSTGFDYIHTDNRSQSIVRITGTTETAHHKREGADTCATRKLLRNKFKMTADGVEVVHDEDEKIEVRVPSIAVNKLKLYDGIRDVKDKLNYIVSENFKDYKKPIVYNLLTSFYSPFETKIMDKSNKQSSSCQMILKGAHEFNRAQLAKGGDAPFVYVQNIPINQHGDSLEEKLDVIQEAKLMAEIAMLTTLSQSLPEALGKDIRKSLNLVTSCYQQFLRTEKNVDVYFKDSVDGSNARVFIDQIKVRLIGQTQNIASEDKSMQQLAAFALARMFANGDHLNMRYGILLQSLSVFLEQASLAGCKSANERYQSISGRVDLLKSINRGERVFSEYETEFRKSLEAFVVNKDNLSDIESLRRTLDQAYNEHNLQGAAASLSEEDQGASSKVKRFVEKIWNRLTNTNTNIAESEYLTYLHQDKSGALQAHSTKQNNVFENISRQAASLRTIFENIGKKPLSKAAVIAPILAPPAPPIPAPDGDLKEVVSEPVPHDMLAVQARSSATTPSVVEEPPPVPHESDSCASAPGKSPVVDGLAHEDEKTIISNKTKASFIERFEKDGSISVRCTQPPAPPLLDGNDMPTWECIQYVKDQIRELLKAFARDEIIIDITTNNPAFLKAYMLICQASGIKYENKSGLSNPNLNIEHYALSYKLNIHESFLSRTLGIFKQSKDKQEINIVINRINQTLTILNNARPKEPKEMTEIIKQLTRDESSLRELRESATREQKVTIDRVITSIKAYKSKKSTDELNKSPTLRL